MTNDNDTTDTQQVVSFADRLRYVLDLKINKLDHYAEIKYCFRRRYVF